MRYLGTASAATHATSASVCVSCVSGYYSASGASVCAYCGPNPYSYNYHWVSPTAATLQSQCHCDVGWTGTNCEYNKCSTTLSGASLGSLLVQSDAQLTVYSQTFNTSTEQIKNAKAYLGTLLSVTVDLNGDGNITTAEMLSALSYRSISLLPQLKLWCRTTIPGGYCYADRNPNMVEVTDMYNDMVNNFLTSAAHTFDGSGNPLVSTMLSTYPSASWSDSQCQATNMKYTSTPSVTTNWAISSLSQVSRVCGYVNGDLSSLFTTTDILSGKQTQFIDSSPPTATNFKRIYCVSVDYTIGSVKSTSFECSVGLFYVSIIFLSFSSK